MGTCLHKDSGSCHIKLNVFNINKRTVPYTMLSVKVNHLSKHPVPHKV